MPVNLRQVFFVYLSLFFFIFLAGWQSQPSQAPSPQTSTPLPSTNTPVPAMPTSKAPMSFPGLLTPPPTVYPPTQADQGAQTFFLVCMVCHGDQGQGLDLWRQELSPPDNNCWQSKCHAPNHLKDGFVFPHEVPAVKGPGLLAMFQTADNLHTFIKGSMPYQKPGSLTDEQYWQLTAFLLRLNGVDPGTQPLDAARAKTIFLLPQTPTPVPSLLGGTEAIVAGIGVFIVLVGVVIGIMLYRRRRI